MAAKKKTKMRSGILAKARQVLEFAERCAAKAADRAEFRNALFTPNGKASLLFPTEAERTAFCRTKEYKRILALMDKLPPPPVKGVIRVVASANGLVRVE